eukprot:360521-Chlamydomonas_euryale.AAC.2
MLLACVRACGGSRQSGSHQRGSHQRGSSCARSARLRGVRVLVATVTAVVPNDRQPALSQRRKPNCPSLAFAPDGPSPPLHVCAQAVGDGGGFGDAQRRRRVVRARQPRRGVAKAARGGGGRPSDGARRVWRDERDGRAVV